MRNLRVTRRGKTMVSKVSQSTPKTRMAPAMMARGSGIGSPQVQILDQKLIRCFREANGFGGASGGNCWAGNADVKSKTAGASGRFLTNMRSRCPLVQRQDS